MQHTLSEKFKALQERILKFGCVCGSPLLFAVAVMPAFAKTAPDDVAWAEISTCTDLVKVEIFLAWFPESRHAEKARACKAWLDLKDAQPTDEKQSEPEPIAEMVISPKCDDMATGSVCWRKLTDPPGCNVLDPDYRQDLTVSWSGACPGNVAQGPGSLVIQGAAWTEVRTGEVVRGQPQGRWTWQRSTGIRGEGPMIDGRRHGLWTLRFPNGYEVSGTFVDDIRHGRWTSRAPDGSGSDGNYLGDKAHGQWQVRRETGRTFIYFFDNGVRVPEAAVTDAWEPEEDDPSRFATAAVDFRTAATVGADAALAVLGEIPGFVPPAPEMLWRPYFSNTIVKLGRLYSPAPVAMYYNPLLDVAVITVWEKTGGAFEITAIRALPGTHLMDSLAVAGNAPEWLTSEFPLEVLIDTASARLRAFSETHPLGAFQGADEDAVPAADAESIKTVLLRLGRNALGRVRWETGDEPWLTMTLGQVENALSSASSDLISAAAPDTDPETAAALGELPTGYVDRLMLDMVFEYGESGRLIFGSLPDDGDVYVLVSCTIKDQMCPLDRFLLLSLSEQGEES